MNEHEKKMEAIEDQDLRFAIIRWKAAKLRQNRMVLLTVALFAILAFAILVLVFRLR